MLGELKGDLIEFERADALYDRGYGEKRGRNLVIDLFEGVYLQKIGKIKIKSGNRTLTLKQIFEIASNIHSGFEVKYAIFEDLNNRGLRAKYTPEGYFLVFPRGVKRGMHAESLLYGFSDYDGIEMTKLRDFLVKSEKLGLKLTFAIVDQEWEVTYYRVRKIEPEGEMDEITGENVKGVILGDHVFVENGNTALYTEFFFGNRNLILVLSKIEAKYLQDKGILELNEDLKLNEREDLLYRVYRYCRDMRLVVKTGFKFGSDFRAYRKIKNIEELGHSEYLINVMRKDDKLYLTDMACSVRLAHNVRKKMVYAVVDRDIEFIEIKRVRI